MKPGRIVALVIGVVLILPGIGAMFGGSALGLAYAFGRDDAGFIEASIDRLETPTVAITAEDIDLTADPGDPDEFFDVVDADVRLRVTGASSEQEVFVGVGPEAEVDLYLSGVAHDEIRRLDEDGPVFRSRDGGDDIDAPTDQSFWVVSASGRGTQELVWEAESGRWAAVLMNADGSPAVAADVDVGVKAGIVLPLAIGLMVFGFLLTVGSVALIVFGARGAAAEPMTATVVPPARAPRPTPRPGTPVTLEARIDPELSSWQWLVKWFLAIPHYVVLFFLWIGFAVTTVIAFFAILFTGRYPASLFDYAVGVLRWSWRVSYYATSAHRHRPLPAVQPRVRARLPGDPRDRPARDALARPRPGEVVAPRHPALPRRRAPGRRNRGVGIGDRRGRRHRPAASADLLRRCRAARPQALSTRDVRPDRRREPMGLPSHRLRRADDRRVPAVPARPGRHRTGNGQRSDPDLIERGVGTERTRGPRHLIAT